jgi:hypothetical protein
MTQLVNFDDVAGTVMFQHTDLSATGAGFEHAARMALATLRLGKLPDGVTPDQFTIMATCPICGAVATISITGSAEAQRLIAHAWRGLGRTAGGYPAAVAAVNAAIAAAGGVVRLDPSQG